MHKKKNSDAIAKAASAQHSPHAASRVAVRAGRTIEAPLLSGAERLVGLGFRHWMLGYQTGDIGCWEAAWSEYSTVLGPSLARGAVSDLACWVRSIARLSRRSITVWPSPCARFCRDECMAVSLVAAGQHDVCPAMRACAFALIEHPDVDAIVADSLTFASRLRSCGQVLAIGAVANAAAVVVPTGSSTHH